jgi:predicted Zn-dependent peptidase
MRADRSRLPAVGPDPAFAFPPIVRHRLGNGLDVRTVEHTSLPVVTFVIQIDGGTGADPAGREGLAAITADMVDEGTGTLDALDVSEALARLGASYDVDVGADATAFTLTTISRFADGAAALLSDILTRPTLSVDDFDRLRQMRLDRLKQLKDMPPAVAERAFLRLLYWDHPYGHLAIGSDSSLRSTTLGDVTAFHATAFQPSRATLVVAGAHSHQQLLGLAEAAFGQWNGSSGNAAMTLQNAAGLAADHVSPRLAIVPRDGAAQSELRIGQLSARRSTPDYHALVVMNAVLGGQFVSRINLKLREEKGYTYGARTGFDWRRGLAPFALQASVHTAATADAISDSLRELESIRGSRPPTDTEMALARASLTRGYPRLFETAQQVARSVAQLALYGLPDSYFEEFVPRINAVESADVVRVSEQYLDPDRLTTLVVGDHQVIEASLERLGLGAPRILPVEF